MFKFLWNQLFGLKCPTQGCGGRLKQVKESLRPTHDQFTCTGKCKLSFTGSMLKQNHVNGYDKRDPTGRRKQAVIALAYDCPICYEAFPMSIRKFEDVTLARFQCPICKRYFPNLKYVKPEPAEITVNLFAGNEDQLTLNTEGCCPTITNPAEEFVPVVDLCDNCSQQIGTCNGAPEYVGEGKEAIVTFCPGYTKESNELTKPA